MARNSLLGSCPSTAHSFCALSLLALTIASVSMIEPALGATRVTSVATGFGRTGDNMGQAVAIFGDTALAGSPMAQAVPLEPTGVVQVFRRGASGWAEEAILLPNDPVAGAHFGAVVSLGQDIAAVGTSVGSYVTYTFVRNGTQWTQADELTFGGQPSLSGDTLAINNGVIARIYVRENNAWVAQADLQGDQPDQGEDVLGAVVSGDLAAISTITPVIGEQAINDQKVAFAEYFFARSNGVWVRETKLDLGTGILGFSPLPIVVLSGQTAVVAQSDVRAFVRSNATWTFQGFLDPGFSWFFTTPPPGLTLDGDTAVVGLETDSVLGMGNQGSAYVFTRSGDTWTRSARPYDPSGTRNYLFGSAVALSGTSLVVGSPGAFIDSVNSGKITAFEYTSNAWTPISDLGEGNAHADEQFGSSVAASGNTMVVGAPYATSNLPFNFGAAYVFDDIGGSWVQRAELMPPSNYVYFGSAVALDGTTAVVGSQGDYIGNNNEYQAVYVYTKNGNDWQQEARIGSGVIYSNFGVSLGLVADTLAVGDSGWPDQEPRGRVRMFARANDTWTEQPMIQPVESADNDQFGRSLAMTADTMIVGAPGANVGIESAAGAAYVFQQTLTGWQEQARLVAPKPLQNTQFGSSVALAGDTVVVGPAQSQSVGSADVFKRSGGAWTWIATLSPTDGTLQSFGYPVALSGDETIALVGALKPYNPPAFLGEVDAYSSDGNAWLPWSTFHGTQNIRDDGFGVAMTFFGSAAFIGAPGEVVGGAVYVTPMSNEIFSDGFD